MEEITRKKNVNFQVILIEDTEEAQQNGIHPYGTFCAIYDGNVIPYKPGIKKELVELLNKSD